VLWYNFCNFEGLKKNKKMKKLLIVIVAISLSLGLKAQDSGQSSPEINFDKLVHDFGKVMQGDKTEYEFVFKNTGKVPLIISDVKSSCGCTVPEWPRNPIMPGGSATIKVKYNSNIIGAINKQVTIISNASNSPTVLRIAGSVEKMPGEILPFQQQSGAPVPTSR
jgi:hypothetical protein